MNIAIIPAAGSGTRLGGAVAKQFIEIAGAPILMHTLRRFDACDEIDAICLALPLDRFAEVECKVRHYGVRKHLRCVVGGNERSESIYNVLEAIADLNPEIVAVHDAVRPFVTPEQIAAVVRRAHEFGGAILALPSTDTIKEVGGGFIRRTLDRQRIYRAQTPQAFRYELLCQANAKARAIGLLSETLTDDAMLVEQLGVPIAVVEGSPRNFKITTSDDLILAVHLFEQASADLS